MISLMFISLAWCIQAYGNPVLVYGTDTPPWIQEIFEKFDIPYENIKSLDATNDSHLYLISNLHEISTDSLPKHFIAYQTVDLMNSPLTDDYIDKLSRAITVWDSSWKNIATYRSQIHNFYYFPENYEYADPVILSCRLPIETLDSYKQLLCYSNTYLSDIASHLPIIYAYTILQNPDMIVEAGVRGGDSTQAFAQAMNFSDAMMIGLDIAHCPGTAYSNMKNGLLLQMNDLHFPAYYQSNGLLNGHNIDIIFIDTSHYYDHTLAEISQFAPLLAKNGFLLFHDSHMSPLNNPTSWYCIEGTIFVGGWDNQKGVIRAIRDYFSLSYDEAQYQNFHFIHKDIEWHLIHYPFCNGLTLIRKLT